MIFKICSSLASNRYIASCTINILNRRRFLHHTHYEVLNLPKDCTQKEIRDAYIKLSKQVHPDKNNNKSSHANFVNIVAAYNVLSKPDLRRVYDLGLHKPSTVVVHTQDGVESEERVAGTVADPIFWKNRNKSQDQYYENQPYYGIKGLKKVSNVVVVAVCLAFAAFGVALQILAIRKSLTFKRHQMMLQSKEAQKNLSRSKAEADRNGNAEQIERLKAKFIQNQLYNTSYEKKVD